MGGARARQPRAERGAPISLAQAMLDHSNLAITSRYTHAGPEASACNTWPSEVKAALLCLTSHLEELTGSWAT